MDHHVLQLALELHASTYRPGPTTAIVSAKLRGGWSAPPRTITPWGTVCCTRSSRLSGSHASSEPVSPVAWVRGVCRIGVRRRILLQYAWTPGGRTGIAQHSPVLRV